MNGKRRPPRWKATVAAGLGAGSVVIATLLGSRGGRDFDAALLPYSLGLVCAAAALGYRWTMWAQRPPTALYLKRALAILFARPRTSILWLFARSSATQMVAHTFIARRSRWRWLAHAALAWGSVLATAVTVPLVLGWIHFETAPGDPGRYQVVLFGLTVDQFPLHSVKRYVMFNLLNVSAVLVIGGAGMALKRRLTNPGSIARQQFSQDLLPLLLLLLVSLTGLFMTASVHLFEGRGYHGLSLVHAITVGGTLVYLPFSKLFHPFQRVAHVGVTLYKRTGSEGPSQACRICQEPFASVQHVRDLQNVLGQVGQSGQMPGLAGDYALVCPRCRRRLLGFTQGQTVGRAGASLVPGAA